MNATQLEHLREGLKDPDSVKISEEEEQYFFERVNQILANN